MLQRRNKTRKYFRVFHFTILSSLVNFTSLYERINKWSATLDAYGKSMKVQEIFHLSTSVRKNNHSKDHSNMIKKKIYNKRREAECFQKKIHKEITIQ